MGQGQEDFEQEQLLLDPELDNVIMEDVVEESSDLVEPELEPPGAGGGLTRVKRKIPKLARGITPYKINSLYVNYDEKTMKGWVSPSYSNLVFKKDDVGKVRSVFLISKIFSLSFLFKKSFFFC